MTDTPATYAATPTPPGPGEPLFLAPAVPVTVAAGEAADGARRVDLVAAGIAVLDAGDNLLAAIDRALAGQTVGLLLMYASNEWRRASQALGAALEHELTLTEDRQP